MKRLAYPLVLLILLAAGACNQQRDTNLPGISGSSGEILLVMDDYRWQDTLGSTLRSVLTRETAYLPQPEPLFTLIHIKPAQFNTVFQSHRNIIFVKVNPDSTHARITLRRDVWASPQLVMDLVGPSDTSLNRYILESADQIINRFNQAEKERLIGNARKYQDREIVQKLQEKYHLSMYIPQGYTLDVDSADFAWLSLETPSSSQGILIYTYPYTDPAIFQKENLILKRNQVLRKHVPGPLPGSWMATETMLPPSLTEFEDGGKYYAYLEGLWKLEGRGSMGGPFVSLSTVDEKRQRVVTVEGFVYAPGQDKREYLRQVDAIIHTLKITD